MYVGYIRVSTDDQNLSLQKDALLKYSILYRKYKEAFRQMSENINSIFVCNFLK